MRSPFLPKSSLKRVLIFFGLVALFFGISYVDSYRTDRKLRHAGPEDGPIPIAGTQKTAKALIYSPAQELVRPGKFINSQAFELRDVIGKKVILLNFWASSCINCARTLPYLGAWWDKYKDEGLLVLGVHTPEFGFEKEYESVFNAVRRLGIKYPVVQDNNSETWNAYGNDYWPHTYLIDIDGYIVYDHVGEGAYEEIETKLQELLSERKERGEENVELSTGFVEPKNVLATDPEKVKSPEVYFGALRNDYLDNGLRKSVSVQTLELPEDEPELNSLYLGGNWGFRDEFAHATKAPAKVLYRYSAKDVYMVASSEKNNRVKVIIDGKLIPNEMRGADVDSRGYLNIKDDRIYNIVKAKDYGEHTLELIIESPALRIFLVTFG